MRLPFFLALILTLVVSCSVAYGQVMPQQQNCTTTTSGSISHTWCGPPVIVQVQAPAVTVTPAPVTIQPAPPAPAPMAAPMAAPPKKIRQ